MKDYYDHLKFYDKKYLSDPEFKKNTDSVDVEALRRKWLHWYPAPPANELQVEAFIEEYPEYDVDVYEYLLFRWIEETGKS